MEEVVPTSRLVRFGTFEVDLRAGEVRKAGVRLKLSGQPFQVLAILLERPGDVVTREELQKRLWPDTFVDVDHNLNTAINKIREVLGDSAESPRFVETLPRRGYRFIASVDGRGAANAAEKRGVESGFDAPRESRVRSKIVSYSIVAVGVLLVATASFVIYKKSQSPRTSQHQRALTRLTFDPGLQMGATWSPDGRFIAYSSNRGGKFDIWVQQVSGGDPVRITKGPGHNWQPDWSPDGRVIAYRSEDGEGGLFIVPALGGEGLERKIASFGYYPRWSPNGSQILFQKNFLLAYFTNSFYLVAPDGGAPREVFADFISRENIRAISASWHPDGKRISIWGWDPGPRTPTLRSFWTLSVAGGGAVRSELAEASVSAGRGPESTTDVKFSWAPSARAIYFERTFRSAKNVWKMGVDSETLRAMNVERLTTGPGFDTELALSADGRKIAFTVETQQVRGWLFPFDVRNGRVTGPGKPVTSPAIEAWWHNLSRDGKKLAFAAIRGGKWDLWEKSLVDGREFPIRSDNYIREVPQWSPDGTRLAYSRTEFGKEHVTDLAIWSSQSHDEIPLTALGGPKAVYDWSPDGSEVLVSQENKDTRRWEVVLLKIADAPLADVSARTIVSDPAYDLYQPHFSPDGRSIVFEALKTSTLESRLYVTLTSGGPWIPITDGQYWDDKPRWSPDAKMIYFVSGRGGVFNVWGIHFDPARMKPKGQPFPVTAFETSGPTVPRQIQDVELSITADKLVLTMEERSGSIWVLNNVGP